MTSKDITREGRTGHDSVAYKSTAVKTLPLKQRHKLNQPHTSYTENEYSNCKNYPEYYTYFYHKR